MKRMTEQEVKEQLARKIADIAYVDFDTLPQEYQKRNLDAATRILEIIQQAGYVRLAEDQSLPENPHLNDWLFIYKDAQEDMLNNYFRKIVKEDL